MKTILISAAFVAFSVPALAASPSGDFPGDRNPHTPVAIEKSVSTTQTVRVSSDEFPGDRNPHHQLATGTASTAGKTMALQSDEFPGDRNPHGRG